MKVAHPIADKIVAVIKKRDGVPVAIADLLGIALRPAINQALSRLTREGTIQRVGRGLYAWPRFSKLLNKNVQPSVHALVQAWARRNGVRVIPFDACAANLLGLSTQVPAKYVYYTNGRTQRVRLGGSDVRFLNRGPKTMEVKGQLTPLIFQALRYFGKDRMTPDVITRLRILIRPRDRADIKQNLKYATVWMKPILQSVRQEKAANE